MKISRIPYMRSWPVITKTKLLVMALCLVVVIIAVVGLPRLRLVGASGVGEPLAIIEDMDAHNQLVVTLNEMILNKYEVVTIKDGEVTLRKGQEFFKLRQRGGEVELARSETEPEMVYDEEQQSLVILGENQ